MTRFPYLAGTMMAALLFGACFSAAGYTPAENPTGPTSWWWDEQWWQEGQVPEEKTLPVDVRWMEYRGDGVDVPAMLARPAEGDRYPAVLYLHGRRGLDDLVQLQVKRIAARGFVVLAPDLFTGRFIEKFPIEHDYGVEGDANLGVDFLLALPNVSTTKACIASHTRGGYVAVKVATAFGRQKDKIACYVSWYPHFQDPNAPEPMQVYRYANEVNDLEIPVMVFIGDEEQYQRRRGIEMGIAALREAGKPARLVVYPGVGRGFDFRSPSVRTFADDLASKDAVQRAAAFIRDHLASAIRPVP